MGGGKWIINNKKKYFVYMMNQVLTEDLSYLDLKRKLAPQAFYQVMKCKSLSFMIERTIPLLIYST